MTTLDNNLCCWDWLDTILFVCDWVSILCVSQYQAWFDNILSLNSCLCIEQRQLNQKLDSRQMAISELRGLIAYAVLAPTAISGDTMLDLNGGIVPERITSRSSNYVTDIGTMWWRMLGQDRRRRICPGWTMFVSSTSLFDLWDRYSTFSLQYSIRVLWDMCGLRICRYDWDWGTPTIHVRRLEEEYTTIVSKLCWE